jgi:LuxR family maltose regulon positive regulatory protein
VHLVITTREDPPLPLARLRARGQLTELRAADLRFTPTEAAEFLNGVIGLDLSEKNIADLETRTEGWIAGLQLAALSMRGRRDVAEFVQSFAGSHRFVLDYLVEEVLEEQPEGVQEFLLQTAILDQLTGSLCDAVRFDKGKLPRVGLANSQAMLETLDRANLFIVPLDEERCWYRYHRLFADLLRQRLRLALPEMLPTLHCRASEWYERNGFVDEAIEHALHGEDFERASTLIEDQFGSNFERVALATLQRWLTGFPRVFLSSRPQLCIFEAWIEFTSGQLAAADQKLRAAEKMLVPSPDEDQRLDANEPKWLGRAAAMRSFMASYRGDAPGAIQYARQALEYLPEPERSWRTAALITLGDTYAGLGQMDAALDARSEALATGKASGDLYLLLIVQARLAEILRQQGKLPQVIELCERQLKTAEENGLSESGTAGWLLGIWGEALAERNDLDRAIDLAKKGVHLAERSGDVLYTVMSSLCLLRVLFSSGDCAGAQEVIQSMQQVARESELPVWAALQLSAWQARIWLAQGQLESASRWAREHGLNPEGELDYLHEVEHVVLARVLIAQRRLEEAAGLLQRLLEAAEAGGRVSRAIEVVLLQAVALQAGDEPARALDALAHALELGEPGGFVRAYVDEGPPMAHLLQEVEHRGVEMGYVAQIQPAFRTTDAPRLRGRRRTTQPPSPPLTLVEPLSERELEVLHLLAEGLTNPEIASRLFLSLNTVKAHTRNIYGKLGVHNRTQAVVRARDLGLL